MNRSVGLRIPFGLGESLQAEIYRSGGHERVVFGLVSHSTRRGLTTLYLRKLIQLQESDYVPSTAHGAVWRGSAMFPVMGAAMEQNLGIVIFHSHDHTGPPGLSRDDLQSADKLIPMFRKRVPTRPHGTVVISRTHACGLVWLPGSRKPQNLNKVRWFGSAIIEFGSRQEVTSLEAPPEYARQSLIVTPEGQSSLARARIAVIGAGGGGSHVIQQLAYLGVGEIVVIDPDVYDHSNRHRLVSGLRTDLGAPKVDIFHRLVRKIGLGGRLLRVRAAVPDRAAVEALRECDIIIGCVDTLFARSDLQEIASRYLIPYVDIGATVRVVPDASPGDPRIVVAGNVFTFIPGNFCLWCCGFLSREKIEAEQNGPTRGYFEKNNQEAQVVSFNGILASQAVTEVLQLITGFRGIGLGEADLRLPNTRTSRGYKKLDGVAGTMNEWGGVRRADCAHCMSVLGAGDIVLAPIPAGQTTAAA
jgi:ThiF family